MWRKTVTLVGLQSIEELPSGARFYGTTSSSTRLGLTEFSGIPAYTPNQKVMEVGAALYFCAFVTHTPPGRQQAPNPICFARGTWKPRIAPFGDSRLQSLPMAVRV